MSATITADALVQHLLPLVDAAPGAPEERIDAVLAKVDLPPVPAYRTLLAATDGAQLDGAVVYGVDDEGDIDAITEPLDYYSPLIALVGSSTHAYGWHTREKVWCRYEPIAGVIEETYPSDLATLHEALAHYVPGLEAALRAELGAEDPDALPSGELPDRLGELDEEQAPRAEAPYPVDEAIAEFAEAAETTAPLDYRDFLTRFDGIEVGDLVVYGAADMVEQQKDSPENVVLIGTLGDEVLVHDVPDRCWSILDADLDLSDDEDAMETFSDLLSEVLDRTLE